MKTVLRHLPSEITSGNLNDTKLIFQETLHKNANLVLNAASTSLVDQAGLDYLCSMRDILSARGLSLTIFNDKGDVQNQFEKRNIDGQRKGHFTMRPAA